MPGKIDTGSSVTEIICNSEHPVTYVTGILDNFVAHGHDRATDVVRVGVTGTGVYPNYRIEKPSYPTVITVSNLSKMMTCTPAEIFNGRNHREMSKLYDKGRHDRSWSPQITFAGLEVLLSSLSQRQDKHAPRS
jgi:hypothetical protein